jgi:hypothetical protein
MRRHTARTLALLSLLYVAPVPMAQAALRRVGPVVPTNGYPAWYQDQSGLTMDFCSPTNALELNGGWCLILPPATAPEVFPTSFFNEHFYWAASSTIPAGASRATAVGLLTLSVEAAFASGPVTPGDQITFGRLRIVIPTLPVSGTYTIYHPFGAWVFPGLVAGDRFFYTDDVGFNCAQGQFDCALATSIGPYLLPSTTPGGAELPPIPVLTAAQDPFYAAMIAAGTTTPYPGSTATATPKYIADPARAGPVTGSPLPGFTPASGGLLRNHNIFLIEVTDATGRTTLLGENANFSLQGRIFEGAIPGQVTVDRASYTAAVGAAPKLDVFATATAGIQARVPPAPAATLLSLVPTLEFWDNPCTLDPITLLPIGPPPIGAPHQIFADAARNKYWGQSPPPVVPPSVCVAQTNAPAAAGGTTSVYYSKSVEDEVTVGQGLYDPAATSLSVNAASSDLVTLPALSLVDYGPLVNGAYAGTLLPPPATLHVLSSAGGVAAYQTNTSLGVAALSPVPVAVNDTITMFEDCSALPSAAPCATPVTIHALANDTLGGVTGIAFGPGVTVTLVSAPQLGTATVNADGTISYAPNLNASGTDGFSYTVAVTDASGVVSRSNLAGITVHITPVNDLPVAVNDTASTVQNLLLSVNVLANDTDPDGAADVVGVTNLTQPTPAGATAQIVGNIVVFQAAAPGTYTFTYQAVDAAGAVSLTPATVTVTVVATETLTVTGPAVFRTASSRWIISGTDLPPANQVLTIQYYDGPNVGYLLGHVSVDALGNWLFDARGVTGLLNPTTAQATKIIVFSSLGATAIAPISLK